MNHIYAKTVKMWHENGELEAPLLIVNDVHVQPMGMKR